MGALHAALYWRRCTRSHMILGVQNGSFWLGAMARH